MQNEYMIEILYNLSFLVGMVLLGLSQVWMGAYYSYPKARAPKLRNSIWQNLLDGNLFVFSLGTAGTVFAVLIGHILTWHKEVMKSTTHSIGAEAQKLHATTLVPNTPQLSHTASHFLFSVLLMLLVVTLVFFAVTGWFTIRTEIEQQSKNKHPKPPSEFSVQNSTRCAFIAVLLAFLTEQLR